MKGQSSVSLSYFPYSKQFYEQQTSEGQLRNTSGDLASEQIVWCLKGLPYSHFLCGYSNMPLFLKSLEMPDYLVHWILLEVFTCPLKAHRSIFLVPAPCQLHFNLLANPISCRNTNKSGADFM